MTDRQKHEYTCSSVCISRYTLHKWLFTCSVTLQSVLEFNGFDGEQECIIYYIKRLQQAEFKQKQV